MKISIENMTPNPRFKVGDRCKSGDQRFIVAKHNKAKYVMTVKPVPNWVNSEWKLSLFKFWVKLLVFVKIIN